MIKRFNRISLALGVPGLILNSVGLCYQMQDPHSALTVLASVGGSFLLISGLAYYAVAKGRDWKWGFFGFLGIVGVIVLGFLRDKASGEPDPAERSGIGSRKTCRLAVWSLGLGIVSLVGAIFTSIPGIICGHIALRRINCSKQGGAIILTGRKIAIAGLILCYLFLLVHGSGIGFAIYSHGK